MEKKPEKKTEKIAVVRIRGQVNINKTIKDTLNMLRLYKKNYCVVIEKTPSNLGMVQKVKDFVTYGEIDDATLKILIEKRAEKNPKDPKKTKGFFRLAPPRHGFERKGIKVQFNAGGALGYRKNKINDLIKRMV